MIWQDNSLKIRIAGIVNESITDGPGLRFTVFTQGCPHKCAKCHNPHTWDVDGGYDITIEELMEKAKINPLICGVTISGGEPFIQAHKLLPFLKKLKEENFSIFIYTGYLIEEILSDINMKSLLFYTDILVDGKFISEKRNLDIKFKGSENQRVIDVPKTLKSEEIILVKDEKWS